MKWRVFTAVALASLLLNACSGCSGGEKKGGDSEPHQPASDGVPELGHPLLGEKGRYQCRQRECGDGGGAAQL